MHQLQIGIIGSMGRPRSREATDMAARIGRELARRRVILLFGYEDDGPSFPGIAAQAARKSGGTVLAFLRNGATHCPWGLAVRTGTERGGGREWPFIKSCDAIIALGGGSGTLMEIAIAYQARIPVVGLTGSGGWTDRLNGTFLDERQAERVEPAGSPREAVDRAVVLAKKKLSVI